MHGQMDSISTIKGEVMKLIVEVKGHYWSGGAVMDIPELYYKCFEPLKTTDVPEFYLHSHLTGEYSEEMIPIAMKIRSDAAEILAKALATMIVCEMSKYDKHNGYTKKTMGGN